MRWLVGLLGAVLAGVGALVALYDLFVNPTGFSVVTIAAACLMVIGGVLLKLSGDT